MPDVANYDNEGDWMAACVPARMEEGDENDRAVAACLNIWRNRNKAAMESLWDEEWLENIMSNKYAASIKAQDKDSLTIAGYGVVWGGKDLEGEYFTNSTDFWFDRITERPMTLYEHGQDGALKRTVIGRVARKTADDVGLWIEAQIDRANQYADAIQELTEKGVLGWSSGAVGHLVDRDKDGRITSWPVVEFSLTPTPAEPRTLGVQALRSLAETEPAVKTLLPQEDVTETPSAQVSVSEPATDNQPEQETTEVIPMSEETKVATLDTSTLAQQIVEGINSGMGESMLKAMQAFYDLKQPAAKGGFSVEEALDDLEGTKSFGDFLVCVRSGNTKRLKEVYGATKDLVEGTGTDGGYLVPEEFLADMIMLPEPYAEVMFPRARKITINRRSVRVPALDQTGTPAKAYQPEYYGGVVARWTEEAGAKSETEPDFKQIELVLHKLAGYTQASDELVADSAVGIDALLRQLFGGAVRFRRDYAYLRGTGIGQPLGILNSGALLTTARDVANQVSQNDLHSMMAIFMPTSFGRGVWVASPGTMEFLLALSDGTNYNWLPNARERPPTTLFGMPLLFSEKLPWLGTTGDVLLIDPAYYWIATSGGLAIDVSQHYAFINDLTTWRFVFRTDGQPAINAPLYIDTTHTVSPFVALLNTTD